MILKGWIPVCVCEWIFRWFCKRFLSVSFIFWVVLTYMFDCYNLQSPCIDMATSNQWDVYIFTSHECSSLNERKRHSRRHEVLCGVDKQASLCWSLLHDPLQPTWTNDKCVHFFRQQVLWNWRTWLSGPFVWIGYRKGKFFVF